ncbi:acyl-CoA dehydrogenase family protein [Humidisolicoccus flavus]|uniref:acyl-CoA dehydrogenase family protein n=1 Tax=Humidisolicoccus flavus TaxID=3111414 RepID=UPI003253C50E
MTQSSQTISAHADEPSSSSVASHTVQAKSLSTSERAILEAADLEALLAVIAETAEERETDHELPAAIYERLAAFGFTKRRVPKEHGGGGLDIEAFVEELVALAAADTNVLQSLRTHILATERYVTSASSGDRDLWLGRIGAGAILGGAWTEAGDVTIGTFTTTLTRDGEGYRLNGRKFYSTGSLLADWLQVTGVDEAGETAISIVPARAEGITHIDDWDGFGQQLTASGTTVFENVFVESENLVPFGGTYDGSRGWQQLVLLAALVGAGEALERIAIDLARSPSHDDAELDPVYLERLGWISSRVFAARAGLREAARATQRASESLLNAGAARTAPAVTEAIRLAERATFQAQVIIIDHVLAAANAVAEVSALGIATANPKAARAVERLWRNVRTIATHNPVLFKQRMIGDDLAFGIDSGAPRERRHRRGEPAEGDRS